MGFKVGSYLTLWKEGNNYGHNYLVRQCSTNRRDQNTGQYTSDFSHFVRFYGKAKEVIGKLPERSRIKITECDVQTYFNSKKGITETTFIVFDCEVVPNYEESRAQRNGASSSGLAPGHSPAPEPLKFSPPPPPEEDDGLPF